MFFLAVMAMWGGAVHHCDVARVVYFHPAPVLCNGFVLGALARR